MTGKKVLLTIMSLSYLLVIIFSLQFVATGFFQPNDILWVVGGIIGLLGFILLFWQYMLGIRAINRFFTRDLLFINHIHQILGKYGFLMILLHPTLLIIDFNSRGFDILSIKLDTIYDRFIVFGKIAFTLLAFIWLTSAIARTKLPYRLWKQIHFLNYPILILVFFHSMNVGTFFANKELQVYFDILFIIFMLGTLYRFLFQLGFTKAKYKITSIDKVTYNTVTITMQPIGNILKPIIGQFVYIQTNMLSENHPFTVSHFNEQTNELSISPKSSGPFSDKLNKNLKVGDIVFLDGPYGVFTREAFVTTKPIVLIAGGIGVTPFLRLINALQNKKITLFYGNQSENDIAFRKELEEALATNPNFKVINVLSGKDIQVSDPSIEKGYITVDLMKKYLGENLNDYDFFICGPPVMMKKLMSTVEQGGVDKNSIHAEKFSL